MKFGGIIFASVLRTNVVIVLTGSTRAEGVVRCVCPVEPVRCVESHAEITADTAPQLCACALLDRSNHQKQQVKHYL